MASNDGARSDPAADPKWSLAEAMQTTFDCRFIFYDAAPIDFAREDPMRHMEGRRNIGLIATRRVPNGAFSHVFVTRRLSEVRTGSDDGDTNLFPLYVDGGTASLKFGDSPRPNYSSKFLEELSLALGLLRTGIDDLPTGLAPEDIFHYVYAVLHSPGYRSRYAESLKIDFPRLPLTENLELFRALARLGGALVALHLLESPKLAQPITEFFVGTLKPLVEKVWWTDIGSKPRAIREVGRVNIGSAGCCFYGVPEDVWNFQIGGYQVCEKWLKDRTGRTLSRDDAADYQRIVVAVSETIRLMKEIDGVIKQHGGWPGAFLGEAGQARTTTSIA